MVSFIKRYIRIRWDTWKRLHQVHPHPISRQIQRQLRKRSHLPIITMTVLWGGVVFALWIGLYSRIGIDVASFLPLLLVLWSSMYTAPWLYQITETIRKQYTSNVVETMGVIPQGKSFIMLAICHAVINQSGQLQWLRIIRILIVIFGLGSVIASLIVTMTQIPSIQLSDIVPIMIDMLLLTLIVWFEHQQSVLLLYGLILFLTAKLTTFVEITSLSILLFILIQFLTGVMPVLFMVLSTGRWFDDSLWSLALISYLCSRELILMILYHFE